MRRKPANDTDPNRAIVLQALESGDPDLVRVLAEMCEGWERPHPVTLEALEQTQRNMTRALSELTDELPRRCRAVELIGDWRPSESKALLFGGLRTTLASLCHPAFATLTYERAAELAKPKRGPTGPAGIAARWSVDCGAFGDRDPARSAKLFRDALRNATPARRARSRSKK